MGLAGHGLQPREEDQDVERGLQPHVGEDDDQQAERGVDQPRHRRHPERPQQGVGDAELVVEDPGDHDRRHHRRHHQREDDQGPGHAPPRERPVQEQGEDQPEEHAAGHGQEHEGEGVDEHDPEELRIRHDATEVLEADEPMDGVGEGVVAEARVDPHEDWQDLEDQEDEGRRGDEY